MNQDRLNEIEGWAANLSFRGIVYELVAEVRREAVSA